MSSRNDDEVIESVIDRLTGQHRDWIKAEANRVGWDYDTLMAHADAFLATGDTIDSFENLILPDFWDHYEAIRNTQVTDKWSDIFECCKGG